MAIFQFADIALALNAMQTAEMTTGSVRLCVRMISSDPFIVVLARPNGVVATTDGTLAM
jgi:hypothetical protein